MRRYSLIVLISIIAAGCNEEPPAQTAINQTVPKPEANDMPDAKAECEELMNVVLPFAEEMLTKHREFFPFGGTMAAGGEISHINGWTGEERPASTDVIELLEDAFREGAQSSDYKATALVYDIRTIPPGKEEKQDAIAIAFDHRDDYSVVVIFPYSFTSDGQLALKSPFMTQGKNKIFAQ